MNYRPSWNIASIPDELILRRAGQIQASRRESAGGARPGSGRKPQFVPCPHGCGQQITKTEAARGHGCQAKFR